jgi:parallel beta-helix repeat protein
MRASAVVLSIVLSAAAAGAAECGGSVPCRCGDVLTGATRLEADLGPCERDGLVLRFGAVLDCAGHTIAGAGPQGRESAPRAEPDRVPSFGIVLDDASGALVENCRVTGFDYGIELSGARDSRVTGVEAFGNGDFRHRVGYGIHLSRSYGNTIERALVRNNADEGIHVGSDSDRNTLANNRAHDNGRENFYVLNARGNRLVGNRGWGAVSANLYMKNAVDTVVEDNRFEERPVVVRGDSHGNVFSENVLGGGIKLQPLGGATPTFPARNVVRGGTIGGGDVCVELQEARDNRFEHVRFDGCRAVLARAGGAANNTLVGVDVGRVRLTLLGGATLNLGHPVRVAVSNRGGRGVAGARLEMRDATGGTHPAPETDTSGAASLIVPTHLVNALGLVRLGPVVLRVRADGFAEETVALGDPPAERISVALERDGGGGERSTRHDAGSVP